MTFKNLSHPVKRIARGARDLWIFFKSGHSGYFTFILSLANFIVLQYNLFVEKIPFLRQIIPNISIFIIFFSLIYFPLAIIVGYFEIKRGVTMRRPFLTPYTQDTLESNIRLRRSLMHFYNGKKDDAMIELKNSEKILKKWRSET